MFDFCINGAGMVGAATALGLAQQGYQVAIIEQRPPQAFESGQPPDLRMSAISVASVELLMALGAWPYIEAMRVRSYSQLSVWEREDCRTDFSAADAGFERLGYFVENRLIQLGCHQALKSFDNVTWYTPKHIDTISKPSRINEPVSVTLEDGEVVLAKWLIGADGAESQVRQLAGIGISGWQYAQQAMGIIVEFKEPVADCTWQQFTPQGPRALLPMHDSYASLIWYDSPARLTSLAKLSPAQLKQAIETEFPALNEDFKVLNKASFTLIRRQASDYIAPGIILVGDAAHTINPLAGQGVNLGFKDVACLLEQTANHQASGDEFMDRLCLAYEKPRKRDNMLMMSAMDAFYMAFSNDNTPIRWLRNGVLKMAQHTGPLKTQVLKYAMGLA